MGRARRTAAEGVGTALLVVAIVGSGIAAQELAGDEPGLVLLANSAATVGALIALLTALIAVSGAHLNPAVTLALRAVGRCETRDACAYIPAQIAGGITGVILANLMFELAPVTLSTQTRIGAGLWLAEGVATFGLVALILTAVVLGRTQTLPYAVAAYIGAAYWFTASTGFANPAVTIARSLTDTFTGISPASVPAFVFAQLVGALVAVIGVRCLLTGDATTRARAATRSTA